MLLYFGLALDEDFQQNLAPEPWVHYLGPSGLIQLLEIACGNDNNPADMDYLRIPRFRKVARQLLEKDPGVFFGASFQSDQFATSKDLLKKRDELILAGWNFENEPDTPPYLTVFSQLETLIEADEQIQYVLSTGFADRFSRLLKQLPTVEIPFQTLIHVEPLHLLPVHWQRLFRVLEQKGIKIQALPHHPEADTSDLQKIQQLVCEKNTSKITLDRDGSFLILKSKRAVDLARQVSKIIAQNQDFRPTCLLTDQSLIFDMILAEEGLPAMGLSQPSHSRPGQQVLKLAGSFLWNPVDPTKILEFTGLSVKPLQAELGYAIAKYISQRPGIMGEGWTGMVFGTLKQIEQKSKELAEEAREQYRFWFERKRYDIQRDAPKSDAIGIFRFIQFWAIKQGQKESAPLYTQLADQARKAAELLEAIPEDRVTSLDIERVVRTIFEPVHTQLHAPQTEHLDYIRQPNALLFNTGQLLWWNFSASEKPYFFTHWTREVIQYLSGKGISLDLPAGKNQFQSWSQQLPLLKAKQQMVLAIPGSVDGKATHSHPLWPLIGTRLTNADEVTFDLDDPAQLEKCRQFFKIPGPQSIEIQQVEAPQPFLQLHQMPDNWERTQESPSSIETMIYYPYQWFFKYVLQWYKSPLLGMVGINTLKGNLAHRLLERLLKQSDEEWSKEKLAAWVESTLQQLMEREGSPLLLYGNEPEKLNFIKKVQFASWTLLSLIRENNWTPLAVEEGTEASWKGLELKARADLVLQRGDERMVVDFKWKGKGYRTQLMKNKEDLQLCMYAWLYKKGNQWPASSWFIIEPALIITRNPDAFSGIDPLHGTEPESVLYPELMSRIESTWDWRKQQLEQGLIEMRCKATAELLEEYYDNYPPQILEMRTEDAPFDDYQVLIQKFS